MKIHRVVQMLGATTSTGKLASDMYDLGHKDYYSKEQDKYIPISHMDFQHMVRAFVKQNEEAERCMKERNFLQEENENLEKQLGSSHRAYKMGFERNGRHIEEVKKLEDIIESNDKIYKKNLQKQEENLLYLTSKIERMKGIIEEKDELLDKQTANTECWKNTYYNSQPKGCGYVFSEIPNDTDGQEFVDKLKKYFNKISYKMRVRGQHIKPELKGTGATYWGQTRDESTHLRVYIDAK